MAIDVFVYLCISDDLLLLFPAPFLLLCQSDWHPRRPAQFLLRSVVFFGFLLFRSSFRLSHFLSFSELLSSYCRLFSVFFSRVTVFVVYQFCFCSLSWVMLQALRSKVSCQFG